VTGEEGRRGFADTRTLLAKPDADTGVMLILEQCWHQESAGTHQKSADTRSALAPEKLALEKGWHRKNAEQKCSSIRKRLNYTGSSLVLNFIHNILREPFHLLSHTFSGKSLCHCLDGTPAVQKQTCRLPTTGNRTALLRGLAGEGKLSLFKIQRNEVCQSGKIR
jgi:hypothetical protein